MSQLSFFLNNKMPTYNERDFAIYSMASDALHGLCELDEENRRNNQESRLQNIGPFAESLGQSQLYIPMHVIMEKINLHLLDYFLPSS